MQSNESNIIAKGIVKAVFSLLAVVAVLWFFYKIRLILLFIIIAFVVTLIGRPIKKFLTKRLKLRNLAATIVTLLIFVGVILTLISIFVPVFFEQGKNLSLLDFDQFQEKIQLLFDKLKNHLNAKNINILDNFSLTNIFSEINLKMLPKFINSIVGILGNLIIGLFATTFISFFLLKDSGLATDAIVKFIPEDDRDRFKVVTEKIKDLLSSYFIGLMLQITILFVLYAILLNILSVQNATLIALMAAMLNLIPYLGPILGWVLMISLTLTSSIQSHNFDALVDTSLYISIGYIIIQLWDMFVDIPLIYSKSVKAHPLEIFLVILIIGTLFGIIGMIVAVPFYTMLRVLFKEFYVEYKEAFTIW